MATAREQIFAIIKRGDGVFPWQIAREMGMNTNYGVSATLGIMKSRGQVLQKNGMYFAEPTWEENYPEPKVKCEYCGRPFRRGWNKDRHQLKCPKRGR